MCPIWPLHLVILYVLALCPLWALCQCAPRLLAEFRPLATTVNMGELVAVNVLLTCVDAGDVVKFSSSDPKVAYVVDNSYQLIKQDTGEWSSNFTVKGEFIGEAKVGVALQNGARMRHADEVLDVTVKTKKRIIDHVFVWSVVTMMALIFINFGCAMHWPTVKAVLKKPIGPLIGMCGQFIFMPLCSYALGLVLFPERPAMRLGLFFTGVSPGGGASNVWTLVLGGNVNLSLAMTTISTLCSFGLIPAWLFSLGGIIFADAKIKVPYHMIAKLVIGLFVPMAIGLALQRWAPKVAAFMVKILKGFSTVLLLFIIIFAMVVHFYIFKLFSWQMVVAGMSLPWLGYLFGYSLARVLHQPRADSLAISIDTGVQNTGIAIFLLSVSLEHPASDVTTVVPVAVAVMTPIPLMTIYFFQKIRGCISDRHNKHMKILNEEVSAPLATPDRKVSVIDVIDP